MFDISTVISRSKFEYWFVKTSEFTWKVLQNNEFIGKITENNNELIITLIDSENDNISNMQITNIKVEFKVFKESRPEYMIGRRIDSKLIENSPISEDMMNIMHNVYDTLIAGIYYLTYDDEKAGKLTERCLKWLSNTDFYIAPASTIYHDAEPCGLLRHSLKVVDKMIELLTLSSFTKVNYHEAILTALVHDWCKIDFYEQYMRNVKDDLTGVWNKIPSYRCKGSALPFGHGVTSMFMAQKLFKLTSEQALAIRWHMGEHSLADNEMHDLMEANEKYPMVLLLQFSDRLSIIN